MSTSVRERDTWSISPVPPASIETELEKLWHTAARSLRAQAVSAAGNSKGDQAAIPTMIRAQVLNFVAYAGGDSVEPGTREQLVKQADYIATKHRTRAIMIIGHEDASAPSIHVTVSARAWDGAGGQKVIQEMVQINAHGPVAESMPSVVLPLLISDLPTFVWWPGDPQIEHSFWSCMTGACQHLVLNSRDFSKPLESMAQFAGFHSGEGRRVSFGDLSWAQLAQWRELVARFFDSQNYRPFLDGVETVTVEYSGGTKREMADGAANLCPALLLAGWLSSRLSWEAVDSTPRDDGHDFRCLSKPSGRQVTIHFKSRLRQDGMPAAIDAVRLKTATGGVTAYFDVERNERKHTARTSARVDGIAEAARSVRMVNDDLPVSLAKELAFRGRDEVFGAALDVAGVMARLAQNKRSR
jgi:glucose-6-phosphate dehydrogenase assembly protein OpcA